MSDVIQCLKVDDLNLAFIYAKLDDGSLLSKHVATLSAYSNTYIRKVGLGRKYP